MLHLILGRAGSGKTHYLRDLLAQRAQSGEEGILFLVPDQFSFETEKAMLSLLGAAGTVSVETMGFSRLCELLFRTYGGCAVSHLDEGGRAVVMRNAIKQCADRMTVYRRHCGSDSFIASMLSLATECKRSAVTPEQLRAAAADAQPALQAKTQELSLLLGAYDAMLGDTAADPQDDLTRACELLRNHSFFRGRTVALDSFKGFTGQQFCLLEQILSQAQEVYLTLTCDSVEDRYSGVDLFSNVSTTARRILQMAAKNGVSVAPIVHLDTPHRYQSEALRFVENGILRPVAPQSTKDTQGVELWKAPDLRRQAQLAAQRILSLVRDQGLRYQEIAVITRDSMHAKEVAAALKRYHIPCFSDQRIALDQTALVRFCLSMLTFASNRRPDALFAALRCGFSPIEYDDIAAAQDYMHLWELGKESWHREWDQNPAGFAPELRERDAQKLQKLNEIRQQMVTFFTPYVNALSGSGTGLTYSKALYDALKTTQIPQAVTAASDKLREQGDANAAQAAIDTWGAVMQLLDQLAVALPEEITLQEYREVFALISTTATVGSVPQGIDEVTVGTAERMRPAAPRAVVIVGANQGIFPAVCKETGLLTLREREVLSARGLGLPDHAKEGAVEEDFLAYTAVCSASEQLIVIYAETAPDGTVAYPSRIVTDLKTILPDLKECSFSELQQRAAALQTDAAKEWICTPAVGVQAYAANRQTVLGQSIRLALQNDGQEQMLSAVESSVQGLPSALSEAAAQKLYAGDLRLSPTAVENFFTCPFRYFCGYGLSVRRSVSASLDAQQRGTLVHYVFEKMISERGSKAFAALTAQQREQEIDRLLQEYLQKAMGGVQGKSLRFYRDLADTRSMLHNVSEHMSQELAISKFETSDCELEISDSMSAAVPPMHLPLPDGSTLSVSGIVDRVDVFRQNDNAYVRIIDYKTGLKNLRAGDVYEGLSLQMLCYLFALRRAGAEYFDVKQVIPAGLLYLPARKETVAVPYGADDQAVRREHCKQLRMNGLLLDDSMVLDALGGIAAEEFLPVSYTPLGKLRKSDTVVDQSVMKALEQRIETLLTDMGRQIKGGNIAVDPLDGSEHTGCEYCDYRAVCTIRSDHPHRKAASRKFAQLIETEESCHG